MSDTFRLTMAQLNPIVGDVSGNRAKALDAWRAGKQAGSDFVAMPEMFLAGYQPQDLVLKPAFTADAMAQAAPLAAACADGPPLGIGLPCAEDGNLYNVYAILWLQANQSIWIHPYIQRFLNAIVCRHQW